MSEKLLEKLDEMGVKLSGLTHELMEISSNQILNFNPFKGENCGVMKSYAIIKDILTQGYGFAGQYCKKDKIEFFNQKFGKENIHILSFKQLSGLDIDELRDYESKVNYVFVKNEILDKQ